MKSTWDMGAREGVHGARARWRTRNRCACSPKTKTRAGRLRQRLGLRLSHCGRCCRPPPPCCCTASAAPPWRTPSPWLSSGRRPCRRTPEQGEKNTPHHARVEAEIAKFIYLFIFFTTGDQLAPPGGRWPTSPCWQTAPRLPHPANFNEKVAENQSMSWINSRSRVVCTT